MKTKQKHQKPIDFDIHLKYKCSKCGYDHWLSYRETSTKNFKFVCDCGKVYKPKRIVGFKLKYEQDISKVRPLVEENHTVQEPPQVEILPEVKPVVQPIPEPNKELISKASELLIGYGFTPTESVSIVKKVYGEKPCDDYVALVKNILESLRN